ncbi:MAG TPA: helix-turn-helix transcriptional regulator [Planctomycetota bacterium]|nr:helix-turn-helix transcriptional regulator [Planctomycetota bacterium]
MSKRLYAAGQPSVVYVVDNQQTGTGEVIAYRAPFHGITLNLRGTGRMKHGPYVIPDTRPLVWLIPDQTEVEECWVGSVHSLYTTFTWPGLSVQSEGVSRLKFSWSANSIVTDRCKYPDAHAQLRIQEIFQQMKSLHGKSQPVAQLHLSGLLLELFCIYLELPEFRSAEVANRTLARYQSWMEERWADDCSIEDMAERLGTSGACLRRVVRTHLGLSPLQHRMEIRLAKARELLLTTDIRVKEAARQVGISDPLYFSNIFRKRFGLSPRELVRRYRIFHQK